MYRSKQLAPARACPGSRRDFHLAECNLVYVDANTVAVGAGEAVIFWALRQGQEVARLEVPRTGDAASPRVTRVAMSPDASLLAAGYR